MYSRSSWGGPVDPFILIKFIPPPDGPQEGDPTVSLVVFEWKDRDLIGIADADGGGNVRFLRC